VTPYQSGASSTIIEPCFQVAPIPEQLVPFVPHGFHNLNLEQINILHLSITFLYQYLVKKKQLLKTHTIY